MYGFNNINFVKRMANKGNKEIQQRVEDEITCPVCQDHFQEPKILPCCHYYCKECIQKLAQRAGANQPFPCPECRSDTLLPRNDPNQLPTAFFVNRMKELHTKMDKSDGKVEALCEQCSGGEATAFCHHCTEFICEECVKSHQKMKAFAEHEVTTLENLRVGKNTVTKTLSISAAVVPAITECAIHDEPMKIYCFNCNCLVCRDCLVFDHKEHKCEFVKKAASGIREKLTEHLIPLRELQMSLNDATKMISKTKSDIEVQHASVAATVERSFDELYSIIHECKLELLESISTTVNGKLGQLSNQEKKLKIASETIQNVINAVEQKITGVTEEELMITHKEILSQVLEESKKYERNYFDLEPVEEADMEIEVNTGYVEDLKKICLEKTKLKRSLAYKVEGPGIENPEVKKPTQVIVSCMLPNGKPSLKAAAMKATLTSSIGGSVIHATVNRVGGNSEVEFTPCVRGRHKLEVSMNDQPVKGSPFQVVVSIPPTQLGKPVKVISGVKQPIDITINSRGELVIAENRGNIVVLDKSGKRVRSVEKSHYGFKRPEGIAVDKDDNIYMADHDNKSLFKFSSMCQLVEVAGSSFGQSQSSTFHPWGVTVVDEQVMVLGSRDPTVLFIFTRELELLKQISLEGDGLGIAHDISTRDLYICDYKCGDIRVVSLGDKLQGKSLRSFSSSRLSHPHSICIARGLVYVSDWGKNTVSVFNMEGTFVTSFGGKGMEVGQFNCPSGLALDDDGFLYVCNLNSNLVQVF